MTFPFRTLDAERIEEIVLAMSGDELDALDAILAKYHELKRRK